MSRRIRERRAVVGAAPLMVVGMFMLGQAGSAQGQQPCNWTVPGDFPSIQGAIDAASDGEIICVLPGRYQKIDFKGKAVKLRSTEGPTVTVIDGEGTGPVVLCAMDEERDTVLQGFTITGGSEHSGEGGGGMYNSGASPTVIDCIFVDNTCSNGGAVANYHLSGPRFINCLFARNTATGGISNIGGAIAHVDGTDEPVAELLNCTIVENSAFDGTALGGGIFIGRESPLKIVNCIFWANSDGGGRDESAQIHVVEMATPPTAEATCIEGLAFFTGNGNLGIEPQLTSGLRLESTSPCIDAGNTEPWIDTATFGSHPLDLDGAPRVVDAQHVQDTGTTVLGVTVDIGAFEWHAPPCDVNRDGLADAFDIEAFIQCLLGP